MRSIPGFYTANKLLPRQVVKYDIREPGPYPHLWRGGNWAQNTHPQECIFAAKDSNKNGNRYPHQKKNIGKQLAQKENTQNTDKHDHATGKFYTRDIYQRKLRKTQLLLYAQDHAYPENTTHQMQPGPQNSSN